MNGFNAFALTGAILIGVALAQSAQPAVQSPRDPIQITSLNNGQFRFARGGTRVVHNLQGSINGCWGVLFDGSSGEKYGGNVRARVLDQVFKAGFWYVVMQVGTNTGCNIQGMCGAGLSTDVIWLKLNVSLRLISRQAVSVENCATNTALTRFNGKTREGNDTFLEMRGGVLSLEARQDDFSSQVSTVTSLRYDRRVPERGLVISSKKTPLK